MLRWITRALAILVIAVAAFVVLDFAELLVPVEPDDTQAMADTIPHATGACSRRPDLPLLDPEPGTSSPCMQPRRRRLRRPRPRRRRPHARAAGRGRARRRDRRPGRHRLRRRREVRRHRDEPFEPVTVPNEQYFLLGDNRSAAIDSRTFGPCWKRDLRARVRRLLAASGHRSGSTPARALRQADRLRLAFAHEWGRRRSSGHSRRGRRDPGGRRDGRRCGRRDGARVVRRRDGDERPARGLPRDRVRRLARDEPRRIRGAVRHRQPHGARDRVRRRACRLCDRAGVVRGSGLPGALGELWERLGRLPWARLCEPRSSSRARVSRSPRCTRARSRCSASSFARAWRRPVHRDGRLLGDGDILHQPGLVQALDACRGGRCKRVPRLARRGAPSDRRDRAHRDDLASYRRCGAIRRSSRTRAAGSSRAGLSGVPELLPRVPDLRELSETERVLALVAAFEPQPTRASTRRTWSPSTATAAPASSRTPSASARGGLPGFDVQLNNLLGESDIATASRSPAIISRAAWRRRSCSTATASSSRSARRAPPGSAPRSRRSSARSSTRASTPRRRSRSRVHPTLDLVDAEPGVDEAALACSRSAAARCAAGIGSITTSAASAASAARARPEIRVAAGQRTCCSYVRSSLSMRRDEIRARRVPSPADTRR